jgi:hypothetical protein
VNEEMIFIVDHRFRIANLGLKRENGRKIITGRLEGL